MSIITNNGRYYINGLFAEAVKNTETFNSNVYFSYLFMKTLALSREVEAEYEAALASGDDALATQIQMALEASDDSLIKAGFMLHHFDGIDA